MKASLSVLAALVLVSQAHAQSYVDQHGNPVQLAPQQKVVQYDEASNTVVEVAPQQQVQVQPAPVQVQAAPVIVQQPIYRQRVQEQPTTVIEGSLLKESKADQLRKARTDMEANTEQKIVEKLEESRMRDEQQRSDRAEKLFANSALAEATPTPTPAPAPAVMAQPVAPPTVEVVSGTTAAVSDNKAQAAAEAKLEVKEEPKAEPVDVKQEIKAALDEQEASKKKEKQQLYVSGLAGMGEYPDVINMRGTGSAGFAVGVVTKNRIVVEGGFVYSSYDIQDLSSGSGAFPVFKNLDQYNTNAAVKFQILPGNFRPFIGGLVSYVHRTYSDRQDIYANPGPDASTDSIDVGLTAGLDLLISDNFSVGADFKYMTNVTSRRDSNYMQSMVGPSYNYGTPVEQLEYYTLALTGKFLF